MDLKQKYREETNLEPYAGDDEMYESQEIECGVCEGKIHLEVEHSRSYSTSILGERVTS